MAIPTVMQVSMQHSADNDDHLLRLALANTVNGRALNALLDDEDSNVRLAVVRRLPSDLLHLAAVDPDPCVRLTVAGRMSESDLAPFLDDPESTIREFACDRLVALSKRYIDRVFGLLAADASVFDAKEHVR